VEISKDGKAESVTVEDGIAARVQIYVDEHGATRVRCQVLFVDEVAASVNQKTSPGHASDGS
jgi:hypothetical protein